MEGKCTDNGFCNLIHDPTRVAPCRDLIDTGKCNRRFCFLNHNLNEHIVPLCRLFFWGQCKERNCKKLHVEVKTKSPACYDFAMYGYCEKGKSCQEKHLHQCPDYEKTGKCPRGLKKCFRAHFDSPSIPKVAPVAIVPVFFKDGEANTLLKRDIKTESNLDSKKRENPEKEPNHPEEAYQKRNYDHVPAEKSQRITPGNEFRNDEERISRDRRKEEPGWRSMPGRPFDGRISQKDFTNSSFVNNGTPRSSSMRSTGHGALGRSQYSNNSFSRPSEGRSSSSQFAGAKHRSRSRERLYYHSKAGRYSESTSRH
jgi:hypothetical protein